MNINVKSNLRYPYNGKGLFFVAVLFVIVLVLAPFIAEFSGISPFVSGASDKVISNEVELRNAVKNAVGSSVIVLEKDITLTEPLVIPTNKDITLTSNDYNDKFFKLIGANNQTTITVNDGGALTLAGIIVTHNTGSPGRGVTVNQGGKLTMSKGIIAGNTIPYDRNFRGDKDREDGGGVYNCGSFSMSGGVIANNTAAHGGGVHVSHWGSFRLSGGYIINNKAHYTGAGVEVEYFSCMNSSGSFSVSGSFSMAGGVIANNTAQVYGGGVSNWAIFDMTGGLIADNSGNNQGGGVCVYHGSFSMSGGVITNNVARDGGGVYQFFGSDFSMSGGVISNNTAIDGGGVYIDSEFTMSDGEISGNTATNGGGVCIGNGIFKLTGGKILDNTAKRNGGGICVLYGDLDTLFVFNGAIFSNNYASTAYNRNPIHDKIYHSQIDNTVTWTTPFTQGYNNYDISYTNGTQIPTTNNRPGNTDDGALHIEQYITEIGLRVATAMIIRSILLAGIAIGIILFLKKRKKTDKRDTQTR
ncbi:MAG: hypothetical protein LBH79_07640 [Nitrososphaerota archaeon]|jgi:hypothetical protein|nr:hypothetical protein [Nitrososphaerota archaeon]